MKINTTKLLIILVILVALFAVVRYTGNKDRSESLRSELVSIDTTAVTKVEIKEKNKETILVRDGNQWLVEENNNQKKAVNRTVSSMLSTLMSIEPSRLAARTEEKWKDFSVDSTGTRVKVYEGNEKTLDIILGRLGFENQQNYYTYVRLNDEEDVYVADKFMKMSISVNGTAYRNNVLGRMTTDSIQSVTFNYPDSSFILEKMDNKWFLGESQTDSAATAEYISNYSYISSSSREFAEPVKSLTPDLKVVVNTKNNEVTFSAFQTSDDWIIHSSENPDEYFSDKSLFDKIFVGSNTFLDK